MAEKVTEKNLDLEALGKTIADGLAEGMARNAPKKVSQGEYLRRQNAGRAKLRRPGFQNGIPMPEQSLSNEAIGLLNRITRTGRYINRRVEVIVRDEGAETAVELHYPNKTADMRQELRGNVQSSGRANHGLEDMLQQIVREQDEILAEEQAREMRRLA